LNKYWFPPDAPPTQITKLVVTPQSIGGDGQIAYVWGTDEVAWTTVQNGKTTSTSHKGIFLNVLRKEANGEWKMSHHSGMNQWRDVEAARGDEDCPCWSIGDAPLAVHRLGSRDSALEAIVKLCHCFGPKPGPET